MEFWSVSMELATLTGNIQNIKKNKDLQVSHLLFADDMLVFCRANKRSFQGINYLLESLANNTGLNINRKKSKVFFSRGCSNKTKLCSIVEMSRGSLPVKYLGLPLSINYPKAKNFFPLIDKIRYTIEGWITHSLSFAGRLELIKSVLFSTTAYWYSVYKFPQSTIQSLEAIFANFLWKGKFHAINWKEVCRPKFEGGFGLRKLEDLCRAVALKMIWRMLNNSTLWTKWMTARYIKGQSLWDAPVNILDSGTWKHLTSLKSTALSCIRKAIGNGETTTLWFDPWIQEGRIIDILHNFDPHLSGTENWSVSHIIHNSQWQFSLSGLIPLKQSILNIQISGHEDYWFWLHNPKGKFSFASAWNHVRTVYPKFDLFNVVWFPCFAPKMACCLLKSLLNRLATRDRLFRFGIILTEDCVLCSGRKESIDHLFFQCPFSAYIWKLCKLKLHTDDMTIHDLKTEAIETQNKFKVKDKTYILARLVLSTAVWHIWQERNRRIFHEQRMHKVMVFRRLYEDINVLIRTCHWKSGNSVFRRLYEDINVLIRTCHWKSGNIEFPADSLPPHATSGCSRESFASVVDRQVIGPTPQFDKSRSEEFYRLIRDGGRRLLHQLITDATFTEDSISTQALEKPGYLFGDHVEDPAKLILDDEHWLNNDEGLLLYIPSIPRQHSLTHLEM
ncbi:uncharacterized protein LOC109846208 [Asparagus officinalis]|uniref:uncharacterized protein LOC109846208 n=1 Tax=Asparagus officinalis TaxID=4686 RepID=UPI00098E7910|nr:uncharacterized protein LOC109846208 [Asparagus officinalis]